MKPSFVLLFILVASHSCTSGNSIQHKGDSQTECKIDSIWGGLNLDTTISYDSSKERVIQYTNYKSSVDTSAWQLWQVDSIFHYYRIFSYECCTKSKLVSGEWPDKSEIKSGTFSLMMSGMTMCCAVNHMEQQDCISRCLFNGSQIKDTIPYEMNISSYDEEKKQLVEWKEYMVGWRRVRASEKTYKSE